MRAFLVLSLCLAIVAGACGAFSLRPSPGVYYLTHSRADVDHLLDWQRVVAACPAAAHLEVWESFSGKAKLVRSRDSREHTLPSEGPALWFSTRDIGQGDFARGDFATLGVRVSFWENRSTLQGLLQSMERMGFEFRHAEGITTGFLERIPPDLPPAARSVQAVITDDALLVHIVAVQTTDRPGLCDAPGVLTLSAHVVERMLATRNIRLP